MIEYRILGPLEVSANGRLIEVGGPKLRALLVILLLRANESVPRDVLVHELWGEQPPVGAQHSLDVYVSRLRKSLDAAADGSVVMTRPGAYSLRLAEGQLDARRFEQLVGQGRAALAANAPSQAAEKLRSALELWRGQALADLVNRHGPRIEAARLEELRLCAIEDRIDSDLALGRHADVASELAALAAVHPLRERLHGQLMIALYRSGRQAEALQAYQAARRTLVEELGLEPGPALRRLESAILRQDASLDLPDQAAVAPGTVRVSGKRRPRLFGPKRLAAIAVALAVVIALPVAMTTRERAQLTAGPNTVGVIDGGQERLSAVVTGVGRPNGVAYGAGAGVGHRQRRQHAAAGRSGRAGQRSHPSGPRPGRCGGRRRRGLGRERARRHRFRGEPGIRNSGRGDSGRDRPRRDRLGLRVGMGRQRDQRHGVQDRRGHRRRGVDHFARQCSDRDCRRRRRGLGHQPGHRRTAAHRSDGQPHLAGHPSRPEPGRPGRGRGQRMGSGRRRRCHARQSADRPGADDRGGRRASRSRLRRRRDLGRQRRQRHRVQDRSQHRRDPAHTGRKPADEPGRRRGRVVGHGAALARGPPWRHAHRHRSADITGSPRP